MEANFSSYNTNYYKKNQDKNFLISLIVIRIIYKNYNYFNFVL